MNQDQFDRMENMLTDLIKHVAILNKDMTDMKQEMNELNKKVDRIEKTINSHTEIFKFI